MAHLALTPEEKEAVERVTNRVTEFEDSIGRDFRERCDKLYARYRGYKKFANQWEQNPNDRDLVLADAVEAWGANIVVPYAYAAVETIGPRIIANRPRMLVQARQQRWEQNVLPMRLTIEAQQANIDFELRSQDVLKGGLIYGLGIGKGYWRKEYAPRRSLERIPIIGTHRPAKNITWDCIFDDPDFEPIDSPSGFGWDPYGNSLETSEWVFHRSWRSTEYIMRMIRTGAWNTPAAQQLSQEDVEGLRGSGGVQYDTLYQPRMEAAGLPSWSAKSKQPHEVLEWHDGVRVITVLDRSVVVQDAENPCVGLYPFVTYRPNRDPLQFIGVGVIEPIEPLLRELDTLRSQRRDAATLALAAGYAYDSSAVDEDDLVFGPMAAIEVRNADPRSALMPLQRQEVPGTAYQEEEGILRDLERVVGLQDMAGGEQFGPNMETATGATLMQAAITRRVENQSRRFEKETVRQSAKIFCRLNQRMILEDREMPMEAPAVPGEPDSEKRHTWFEVGPRELMGEFSFDPDGGSMAPKNVAQDRADANMLQGLEGNPNVNQRALLVKRLELLGVQSPETWLTPDEPTIPAAVLDLLVKRGVRKDVIDSVVAQAQALAKPPMGGPQPGPGDQPDPQTAGEPPAEAMA